MSAPSSVVAELAKFEDAKHRSARRETIKKATPGSHVDVLEEILKTLMPIDFREEAS